MIHVKLRMAFTFLSNRNVAVFTSALQEVGGMPMQEGAAQVDLLYFDRYGGKTPPAGLRATHELIDRRRTQPLDHKEKLARRMAAGGLDFPRHYFHPDEVPADPARWWYVKDPLSTGGKGIRFVKREELAEHFRPGYLIQEAVQDIQLYRGHKFTLRTYVLVFDCMVYWFPDSFLVVHGEPWQPDLPDPGVHYSHDGYMKPDSRIQLLPSSDWRGYYRLELPIAEALQAVFALFESELGPVNAPEHFCLFGIDLIPTLDGRVAVVEINDRPNMAHTARVNKLVNEPMLRAMARLLMPERAGWVPGTPFDELMFYERTETAAR